MSLDSIHIEGYKSIKSLDLDLRRLNALIGPNGAGKSNFISIFEMLNAIVKEDFQKYVKINGEAESFLHYGSKNTDKIYILLAFGRNTYYCYLSSSVDGSLLFDSESVTYHNDYYTKPYDKTIGIAKKETSLFNEIEYRPTGIAKHVVDELSSWITYHFHDTSNTALVKKPCASNDNLNLRHDASNLAAFLYRLKEEHPDEYRRIRDVVRLVTPFFDDFILRPFGKYQEHIRLEWKEKGSDFPFMAHHLSDGTIRFICLATLLLQPDPPSTILIDEPELGLHPFAITTLVELMKATAERTQLIVSTQSVPLVNQLDPEDIIVVDREEGQSVFKRPSAEEIETWLDDYGLGDLWEKNIIGGRP